jgi:sugar (pentulose or hexulose) kinase
MLDRDLKNQITYMVLRTVRAMVTNPDAIKAGIRHGAMLWDPEGRTRQALYPEWPYKPIGNGVHAEEHVIGLALKSRCVYGGGGSRYDPSGSYMFSCHYHGKRFLWSRPRKCCMELMKRLGVRRCYLITGEDTHEVVSLE